MEHIQAETLGAVFAAGVFVAGLVVGIVSYFKKNPADAKSHQVTALKGAAIIDSSVGMSLIEVFREQVSAQIRTAVAMESINALLAARDKQAAEERERDEMEELRREVAELKRLRDNQSRRGG